MDSCLLSHVFFSLTSLEFFVVFFFFNHQPPAPLWRFWIISSAIVIIGPLHGVRQITKLRRVFLSSSLACWRTACQSRPSISSHGAQLSVSRLFLFQPTLLCLFSVLISHVIRNIKMNEFQNWRVSRSEWTLCGECFLLKKQKNKNTNGTCGFCNGPWIWFLLHQFSRCTCTAQASSSPKFTREPD